MSALTERIHLSVKGQLLGTVGLTMSDLFRSQARAAGSGQLGAGGHCFPKDLNNLKYVCEKLGIPQKMFSAVLERNDELREKKDWLDMKDRAVTDE